MIGGAAAMWKALPRAQRRMILILLVAVALANIAQPYPDLAPLQHGPTLLLLSAAPWLLRRWPLSNRAVGCLLAFLLLHTLGARYIYSYTPYASWIHALTGHVLAPARNGYDRLVHFAFGALLTLPLAEWARRHGGLRMGWSLAFAFAAIGLGSALYEIFEWLLTLFAASDTADFYNGQQGDMWDAQKDMAAAQLGSTLYLLTRLRLGRGILPSRISQP